MKNWAWFEFFISLLLMLTGGCIALWSIAVTGIPVPIGDPTLSQAGLLFDGFGALLLGIAFFAKKSDHYVTHGTWEGLSSKDLPDIIGLRHDGAVGSGLLLIGFGLQLASGMVSNSSAISLVFIVGLILTLLLYVCYFRKKWVNQWITDIEKKKAERAKLE